jgi:hypothetical protein
MTDVVVTFRRRCPEAERHRPGCARSSGRRPWRPRWTDRASADRRRAARRETTGPRRPAVPDRAVHRSASRRLASASTNRTPRVWPGETMAAPRLESGLPGAWSLSSPGEFDTRVPEAMYRIGQMGSHCARAYNAFSLHVARRDWGLGVGDWKCLWRIVVPLQSLSPIPNPYATRKRKMLSRAARRSRI